MSGSPRPAHGRPRPSLPRPGGNRTAIASIHHAAPRTTGGFARDPCPKPCSCHDAWEPLSHCAMHLALHSASIRPVVAGLQLCPGSCAMPSHCEVIAGHCENSRLIAEHAPSDGSIAAHCEKRLELPERVKQRKSICIKLINRFVFLRVQCRAMDFVSQ